MKRKAFAALLVLSLGLATSPAHAEPVLSVPVVAAATGGVPVMAQLVDFGLMILAWINDGSNVTEIPGGFTTTGARRSFKLENDGTLDVSATIVVAPAVTANQGTPNAGGALSWFFTDTAQLPASLGQKTMANSSGVVIASDQSAVPISGAVTVSGSVTAAQGTAAAANAGWPIIPTDGTQVTGTVAHPIFVQPADGSNALGVTAHPLIVAGAGVAGTPAGGVLTVQGVSGGTPSVTTETYTTLFNGDIQVTNAGGGTLVCPSAPGRRDCMIVNGGPQNLWCKHGVPAVGTGVELLPSVGFWDAFTSATITCIADVAGQASTQTHTSEISP